MGRRSEESQGQWTEHGLPVMTADRCLIPVSKGRHLVSWKKKPNQTEDGTDGDQTLGYYFILKASASLPSSSVSIYVFVNGP